MSRREGVGGELLGMKLNAADGLVEAVKTAVGGALCSTAHLSVTRTDDRDGMRHYFLIDGRSPPREGERPNLVFVPRYPLQARLQFEMVGSGRDGPGALDLVGIFLCVGHEPSPRQFQELLRAEWHVTETGVHAQPHWHVDLRREASVPRLHLAMATEWHRKPGCKTALTKADYVARWAGNCVGYIREQLALANDED